ncbi:Uncharacterised protein [Salmonella bongori]|nr:Uncharacterised protein [Salmonella bongori]
MPADLLMVDAGFVHVSDLWLRVYSLSRVSLLLVKISLLYTI